MARIEPDLLKIRKSVETIGRLSDGLVRLGPFSLGIDALLSWIPGLGEIYSGAAGAFLLAQAMRARLPAGVVLTAAALLGGRTLITFIPFAGPAAADLMTAHKWSARLIVRAIDARLAEQGGEATRTRRWASVVA